MSEAAPVPVPVYTWGESVTFEDGRILVHLSLHGEDAADLVLDRESATLLAEMLNDVATQ